MYLGEDEGVGLLPGVDAALGEGVGGLRGEEVRAEVMEEAEPREHEELGLPPDQWDPIEGVDGRERGRRGRRRNYPWGTGTWENPQRFCVVGNGNNSMEFSTFRLFFEKAFDRVHESF